MFQIKRNSREHSNELVVALIYDDPSISAQRLVERLNGFLGRFGTSVSCDTTSPAVMNEAMYSPCQHPADPAAQDPIDYVMENEPSDPNSESNSGSDSKF